jgi:hypothetical protein
MELMVDLDPEETRAGFLDYERETSSRLNQIPSAREMPAEP